ncbi:MAG TPA: glycerate kinase [Acidimicrobiia bacterium]|nr:glycerate kinase [Acidimicrobiia bacterium]
MRVVAAPDKFRATGSATQIAAAVARAVARHGGSTTVLPMAEGGEGTLDVLGGPNRTTVVEGPLGGPVDAAWRLEGGTAVIEMARASGIALVGGSADNRPLDATTTGTGQLILDAVEKGARRLIVGLGGSATTDGGLGALAAMGSPARFRGVELLVACDVRTRFVEAAEVFGPQKGASPAQVRMLRGRLERLVQVYEEKYGVAVGNLSRSGAAGGLAGGLAAIGAELVDGVDLIAEEVALDEAVAGADLVVTGEGRLDAGSFEGKVVGGVAAYAAAAGVPLLVVAGRVDPDVAGRVEAISLVRRFGEERALEDTLWCVEEAVSDHLGALGRGGER